MSCDVWTNYYYDFLTSPGRVPAEAVRHFQSCEHCRRRLDELQSELNQDRPVQPGVEKLLALQMGRLDRWVSCEGCKPFLPLFLSRSWAMRTDTPIRGHLDNCPDCRRDLELLGTLQLQESELLDASAFLAGDSAAGESLREETKSLLGQIAGREESNALTKTSFRAKQGDAEGPLETVVQSRGAQAAVRADVPILYWAKRVSAAAAVLLLVAFLYIQAPRAVGLSMDEVFHAVQKVHTVCITNSYRNETETQRHAARAASYETAQKICVSDPLGLLLYKTDDQAVLIDQKRHTLYNLKEGQLHPEAYNEYVQIHKPWGLLPFGDMDQMPQEYRWEKSDAKAQGGQETRKVYELTWKQGSVMMRWRGFLNSENLPVRIEYWNKLAQAPWVRITVFDVTYPTTEEMKSILQSEGFQWVADQKRGL